MNIDVNVLQTLSEVDTGPPGLRLKECSANTKLICNRPSCQITVIVISEA